MELLNIGDIRDFDAEQQWKARNGRVVCAFLRCHPEGIPVVLDIKEAAQQGMGPHGLLIGATGSGKSRCCAYLVLALALTHSRAAELRSCWPSRVVRPSRVCQTASRLCDDFELESELLWSTVWKMLFTVKWFSPRDPA